jgi:hypothetical protein
MNRTTLIWITLVVLIAAFSHPADAQLTGEVSYVTSSNVYVKFSSTAQIEPGDTLYVQNNEKSWQPGLTVTNKSSISCVCVPFPGQAFAKGDQVLARISEKVSELIQKQDTTEDKKQVTALKEPENEKRSKVPERKEWEEVKAHQVTGRISASSYTRLKDFETISEPQLRYTFSLQGQQLQGSDIHFESYLSFRHQLNHWEEVNRYFNQAFKVYNLSASLVKPKYTVTMGRKVNRSISNIGAADGLQFNYRLKNLTLGSVLGTRPDISDYGLNLSLPQVGVFVEHADNSESGQIRTTLGFFEQRSGRNTDRRFLYIQHSNSRIPNLYLFGSMELDLYKKLENVASGDFRLTSLYASARYRFNRQYSIYLSYDNRQNVIYYETFKSSIDQLIEQETRQGFRLRFVARPFRLVSIGLSGTYRYQKNNLKPTSNAHLYVNFSRLPLVKTSASLSYTFLDTYYLNSHIIGLRLRRDLRKGKTSLGLHYRWIDYSYKTSSFSIANHISGLDLSWRMKYDVTMTANYEITIGQNDNYQRLYLKLIKRIR